MYDLIMKKKRGDELTREEIFYMTKKYTDGAVPDYQMSSMLMAICLKGFSDSETWALTEAITSSGDTVDLSLFGDTTVDKHSTGGVGDKTTLIVAPTVAAIGGRIAKMSGRGLGHTGGTVDKLESLPGYKVALTNEEFVRQVEDIGIAVVGQSGNLAPADKKIYALRDVTATVDSIPLIASSIMGKKLALGTKSIVLDVKYGSGSFMKTPEDAEALAKKMVAIGKLAGRRIAALITDMDKPLGSAIGNALEVKEATELLCGKSVSPDLYEVCVELSALMAHLSLGHELAEAREMVKSAINSGAAYEKLVAWLTRQGANISHVKNLDALCDAKHSREVTLGGDGYISSIDTEAIGRASVILGGGRLKKEDEIDYSAGIVMKKSFGDKVEASAPIATLYTDNEASLDDAEKILRSAIKISQVEPKKRSIVYKTIL